MRLAEIQMAVEQLSVPEQQQLLRRLEEVLRRQGDKNVPESREDWMHRLHALRATLATGKSTTTGEQILAELRED